MTPEKLAAERALDKVISEMPPEDYRLATEILMPHAAYKAAMTGGIEDGGLWHPDLVIAPDDDPYLFRWYLVPCGGFRPNTPQMGGLVMFHIQVRSDPERPLHDHPWNNMSVILAGRYIERISYDPGHHPGVEYERSVGSTIVRRAEHAHRLILPDGVPYAMTLFSTGPKSNPRACEDGSWGFWYGDGWHGYKRHVRTEDGISVHVNRE